MAQNKKQYADGAVIFREGEAGEGALELISGSVDLLVKRDGKYMRERAIQAGGLFGTEAETKGGIRIFTARANGRTVVRTAEPSRQLVLADQPNPQSSQPTPTTGMIRRLIQSFSTKPTSDQEEEATSPYSNPGLLRRLMDGMGTDAHRIGVRVARLSGPGGEEHTRHLLSAIGHTESLQTRSIEKVLSINPNADIPKQLDKLAKAARRYLSSQEADVLIWGNVVEPGNAIHLHFITLVDWDQQAPGAFDLETTLALPANFEPEMADLLRAVCLAAAIPGTLEKKRIRTEALGAALGPAEKAFEKVPPSFSDREKACLYLCYGNVISTLAQPGYDTDLLARASLQYQSALGNLSPQATPIDWAQARKHLASINHIEAERNKDPGRREIARLEFEETLDALDPQRQPKSWAAIQNRLGMIYYRQGFEDGDTSLLRRSLKSYQAALRVYTRDDAPVRWAEIMSNFAQATQVLGGLLQSPDALATAVNACLSVLEVRDREQMPKAWAASQNNLGSALFLLGKQTRSTERLQAAVEAFESALAIYQMYGGQRLAITTAKNLDRAKDMLDFYRPRNTTQQDWEEALADTSSLQTAEAPPHIEPEPQTAHYEPIPLPGDELPWPGEDLQQQTG